MYIFDWVNKKELSNILDRMTSATELPEMVLGCDVPHAGVKDLSCGLVL